MKITLVPITILMTLTCFSNAEDEAEDLFENHLKEARNWVLQQSNIRWTKSHYSPKFRKQLSIIRHEDQVVAVDYYWTYLRKFSGRTNVGNYLFKEEDIFVRYNIASKSFRLIFYQKQAQPTKP